MRMSGKIYPTEVIELANEIYDDLTESEFFKDEEINYLDVSYNTICDIVLDKYLSDGLNVIEGVFSGEEFDQLLRQIIAADVLHGLMEKGYLNSYEDEYTPETFFLSPEGKEYVKNNSLEDIEKNGIQDITKKTI